MNRRYEYFDSKGNMTGYEFYNTMTRQWEYYELSQRNSTQYRDPLQFNISSLGNATSTLQNRYNNNTSYLQQEVSAMVQSVYNLDLTNEEKTKIINKFQNESLRIINTQAFNYSSLNETNKVLKYLRDNLNKIIQNTVLLNKKSSGSNTDLSDYSKILKVDKISVFGDKYKFIKDENIITDSYIIISENEIQFKRADGTLSYRDLKNKKYNYNREGYEYESEYGAIFIREDLKFVEFFKSNLPTGENYTYYINK